MIAEYNNAWYLLVDLQQKYKRHIYKLFQSDIFGATDSDSLKS
jgi:hypothetical protein